MGVAKILQSLGFKKQATSARGANDIYSTEENNVWVQQQFEKGKKLINDAAATAQRITDLRDSARSGYPVPPELVEAENTLADIMHEYDGVYRSIERKQKAVLDGMASAIPQEHRVLMGIESRYPKVERLRNKLNSNLRAIATPGVDVVPGQQGQLVEQKDQLEQQKQELEQQIAQVDQQMSAAPMTPQPPKEDPTMDPIVPAADPLKTPEAPAPTPAPVDAAPAAPAAPIPATPVTAAVETDKKDEDKKEEEKKDEKKEAAFSIRFAQGKTFNDSYFVAEEKGEFRAVRASRIIPSHIQEKILKCLAATGKPPEDVVTPTEIIDQMTGQGVNSIPTFETAVNALEANASVMTKTAGMFAWNESEVEKPAKVKAGEMPLMSMDMKEFKDGQKAHPVPSGTSSKVKQYYGRLPGAAGGEPTVAINPQSSTNVKDKIDFMRRALEQMKVEKEAAEDKANKAEKKIGDMEKGNEDKESAGLMESIVKDLIAKKLASEKDEQGLVAALAKIDRKNLAAVASLLKLLGKSEGPAMGGDLPGAKPGIGMDAKPAPFGGAKPAAPFGAEQHPKAASNHLPPTFLNESEPEVGNGSAFLAKYWDAK